ncbi:protein of unknown function (plasmid) [Pararobbsia alpina]|uniref:hypothetical protein n=1 Tax=Pararobbsia alpina TaxID=621374 RepID=UPI0039A656FB
MRTDPSRARISRRLNIPSRTQIPSDIGLIDGAGHWIQQEQPVRLSEFLLAFIEDVGGAMHLPT